MGHSSRHGHSSGHKRRGDHSLKPARSEVVWYCCQCRDGPYYKQNISHCSTFGCFHGKCSNCIVDCIVGYVGIPMVVSHSGQGTSASTLSDSSAQQKYFENNMNDPTETATAFSLDSGYGSMASKMSIGANKNSEEWETGSIASLPSRITAVSSINPTGVDGAAGEFVEILFNNEEVRENLKTGFSIMKPDRFERNFNRLLKQYAVDLRKDAPDNLQKGAIRIVHNYRAYVTRTLRDRVMGSADNDTQAEAFHNIKHQDASRLMLERLMSGPQLFESIDHLDSRPSNEGEETDDESQSDNEEPYLPNLERMRNLLILSTAFGRFKASLQDFVTANSPIASELKEALVEADEPSKSDCLTVDKGVLKNVKNAIRKMLRPVVPPGSKRVEWICDCGDALYADLNANSIDTICSINDMFNKRRPISSYPYSKSDPTADAPNGSKTLYPQENDELRTGQIVPNNLNQIRNSKSLKTPKVLSGSSCTTNSTDQNPIYFELCVNAGQFVKSLGEIDVSSISTDGDFFAVVKEHYLRLRGFRAYFWLLKPSTVSYVRFSVEDRCRVGILHKPVALPPKSEVDAKRSTYEPCPLENELPIDPELFIHYLFHCSSPSKRKAWLPRIPRKLDTSIFAVTKPAGFSWGIHIDEGPDYLRIFMLNVGILSLSGISALLWTILRHDFQGAFGFACWIVALLNSFMALFVAKWKQD